MIRSSDVSVIYVKPNGTGNGRYYKEDGSGYGPCDSINEALVHIAEIRGSGLRQPITVKLLGGEYEIKKPVQIQHCISNVTFEPFGNDKVVISGARRICDFKKCVFNGVKCFGAYIEDVKNGSFAFTDLYEDGKRLEVTHYPEEGALRMKTTIEEKVNSKKLVRRFVAEEKDVEAIASFYALSDCTVSFNNKWVDEHSPIEAFDKDTGTVTLSYYARAGLSDGHEYVIDNVKETFKKPGQWYLDKKEGMLYCIPSDKKQKVEDYYVYAPQTEKLIDIIGTREDSVSGIVFRNITFAYTRGDYVSDGTGIKRASDPQSVCSAGAAITLKYASNIRFEDCTLRNYGLHGMCINEGCYGVTVDGCEFYDGGAGGVKINGADANGDKADMTYGNAITDCTMNHLGRRYLAGCGILSMHSYENNFIHNEISDLYYSGISCGWVWGYADSVSRNNRLIGNHIYNAGQGILSDMGGIYLLGRQPGTIVRGNKIHDISCSDYGGWALYTDEGSTGITLEYNLCYRTSSNSYHQHYGSANVVRNNIFAFSKDPLLRVSRPEAHLSIIFTNNICLSAGEPMVSEHAYGAKGAYSIEDGSTVSYRNLFWSLGDFMFCTKEHLPTLADAQKAGLEEESIIADPLFVDALHDDFTLSDDSPVYSLGFTKYDWSCCGPRKRK